MRRWCLLISYLQIGYIMAPTLNFPEVTLQTLPHYYSCSVSILCLCYYSWYYISYSNKIASSKAPATHIAFVFTTQSKSLHSSTCALIHYALCVPCPCICVEPWELVSEHVTLLELSLRTLGILVSKIYPIF